MRPPDARSPRLRPPTARSRPAVPRETVRGVAPRPLSQVVLPVGAGLTVDVRSHEATPLVVVTGELDLATAGMLTAVLEHVRRSQPGPVRVDLSGVTFADTSGLAPVLAPGATTVTAASPAVRLVVAALAAAVPAGARP